jgi:hypothetical protein
LDTLNYGKYLETPTSELNRRTYRRHYDPAEDSTRQGWINYYKELNVHIIMPSNRTPIVWDVFKWYGLHNIKIYNPDENFRTWYFQVLMSRNFSERFSSLKGCMGFFGSAYALQDTFCLLKPPSQP